MIGHLRSAALIGMALVAGANAATASAPASAPGSQPVSPAQLLAAVPADPALPEERAALEAALPRASAPLERAKAELALANWLLARPAAAAGTRVLLGMYAAGDLQTLGDSARGAREHLDAADAELKKATGQASERQSLRRSAGLLQAFARAFLAIAARDAAASGEAARQLATVRESLTPEIAASALLWQSLAWELAGRRERALASLPPALAPPEVLPYDFLSRLLRCRVLADAGNPDAALPLLLRISVACESWFPQTSEPQIQARRRVVLLLALRVGQQWLTTASAPAVRPTAEETLNSLRKSLGGASQPIYLLDRAIPILIKPESGGSRPATAPATAPEV